MKRLLAITLITTTLFGWSFFSSEDDVPAPVRRSTFTLVIDPAGDAKDPGRVIDDTYERSISMQCAEELKTLLEKNTKGLTVMFTRRPGEALEPLQKASFSNRLLVDLYIHLSFFEHAAPKPHIYLYTLQYDPASDSIPRKSSDLTLLPVDQAYRESLSESQAYTKRMYTACSLLALSCSRPLSFPYKPLQGILAPCIGIEIGITTKHQWKQLVAPLAQAIKQSIYP